LAGVAALTPQDITTMEPRIQYAQTADGVSVAFWTQGEGTPFVEMPPTPFSHLQLEWQIPEFRRWFERLGHKRRLVRYDSRGTGLSQREPIDFSLDASVMDLEAVVDRLGLARFAVLAPANAGPAGIAYASRHPDRVSHLILWCTYAQGADFFDSSQAQALRAVVDRDWPLFTEAAARERMGWSEGQPALRFAALIREAITQEAQKVLMDTRREVDVRPLLPKIKLPTLVLHRREFPWVDVSTARELASRIPDAQFVLLEGRSLAPYLGDTESVLSAIAEFLGEGESPALAKALAAEGVHTILFTDVEGSTALTQRLGDARARELLREHERIVRESLRSHGGSEVKTMGDGFMTSFSSATRALECAIAMQRAFAAHNESADEPIRVRVGLNAGEPIAEEKDLYGTAVNLAARIAAKAKGGEILASDVVRGLVAGKDFPFADRGRRKLRGFEEPVRLFEVRWQD
jgi:class 3 adenylate cyclase